MTTLMVVLPAICPRSPWPASLSMCWWMRTTSWMHRRPLLPSLFSTCCASPWPCCPWSSLPLCRSVLRRGGLQEDLMIPLPKPEHGAQGCDGPGSRTPRGQCTGLCWQWGRTGLRYMTQAWDSAVGAGTWVRAVCMGYSAYGAPASPPSCAPCPHAMLFLPWQTSVSTKRLERYLGGEDLETSAIHHNPIPGR